jgi:hypothetical protein
MQTGSSRSDIWAENYGTVHPGIPVALGSLRWAKTLTTKQTVSRLVAVAYAPPFPPRSTALGRTRERQQDGVERGLAAPEARGEPLRLGREQQGDQVLRFLNCLVDLF